MRVLLPHPHHKGHLEIVKSQMRRLGPPEIVVYRVKSDLCIALEGVHRLTAASQLAIEPVLLYLDASQADHNLDIYIKSTLSCATIAVTVRGIVNMYRINQQYPCLNFDAYDLRLCIPTQNWDK